MLIQRVLNGEKIIIAKNNEPLIEFKAIAKDKKKRVFGTLADQIWVADDCWENSVEIEDLFYKSKIDKDEISN